MITLAVLAPVAAVVGLRLGYNHCSVIDPFGLPWDALPLTIARLICLLVVLASTAALAFGFTRRYLRITAVVLLTCSAVAIIPGFFVFFILLFGDPGPECIA
jgi:hypothetical protein